MSSFEFEIRTDKTFYTVEVKIGDGEDPDDKATICLCCKSDDEDWDNGWAWMTPAEARRVAAALYAAAERIE